MTNLENYLTSSNTRIVDQLTLHTPLTIHTTIEQDLNPRSCTVNDCPPVLVDEMLVIEPGEKPKRVGDDL